MQYTEISLSESVDFARLKSAGNTKQKKKCSKGWSCGFTCLPRTKKRCDNGIEGDTKTLTEWLEKEGAKNQRPKPSSTQYPQLVRELIDAPVSDLKKVDPALRKVTLNQIDETIATYNTGLDMYSTALQSSKVLERIAAHKAHIENLESFRKRLEDIESRSFKPSREIVLPKTNRMKPPVRGVPAKEKRGETFRGVSIFSELSLGEAIAYDLQANIRQL